MKFGQYLIDSLNVLNLCLIVAAGAFFFYFLYPLLNAPLSMNMPHVKEIPAGTAVAAAEPEKQPPADYAVIEAQNVFHPNRVIPPEKKAVQQVPRPELVLHGTMIAGGLKVAFVQDKKAAPTSPGRGVRQVALKEGESISGYRLQQVTEKMVVLVSGEDRMTIYLDEIKERKSEITGTGAAPAKASAASAPQRTPSGPARPPASLPPEPIPASPQRIPATKMSPKMARPPFPLPPEPVPAASQPGILPSAKSPPAAAAAAVPPVPRRP